MVPDAETTPALSDPVTVPLLFIAEDAPANVNAKRAKPHR